jgi:hypothetical protein
MVEFFTGAAGVTVGVLLFIAYVLFLTLLVDMFD